MSGGTYNGFDMFGNGLPASNKSIGYRLSRSMIWQEWR